MINKSTVRKRIPKVFAYVPDWEGGREDIICINIKKSVMPYGAVASRGRVNSTYRLQ